MSKKKDKFDYKLIDIISVLSESPKSSWAKVLAKISWDGNMPTLDIRSINMDTLDDEILFGKGISLDEEAVINLGKALLELGYIDEDDLIENNNKRNSIYKKKKKHIIKKVKKEFYD